MHRDRYLYRRRYWRKAIYRGMEIHKKTENDANSDNITYGMDGTLQEFIMGKKAWIQSMCANIDIEVEEIGIGTMDMKGKIMIRKNGRM
jgi:hypothetical protein